MNNSDSPEQPISPDLEDDNQPTNLEDETPEGVDSEKLQQDASQRAREGSLVQRVSRAIRKEKVPYREIIINSEPLERRVALLEDGVLEKFEMERTGDDRIVGSIFTDVVAWFIIVACAATLFVHGMGAIQVASDAAEAMRPLAGEYAFILFSFGLFNASLFAASILPLSTSYTVCEGLGLESGVDKKLSEAPFL